MKLVTLNKLNRLWKNGVLAKMVAKTKVLTTLTQVMANTNAENIAGATAVKELNNNLNSKVPSDVKLLVEGSGANAKYYIQRGADSASKKPLGSPEKISRVSATTGNLEMTVPAGASSGILILCGAHWNSNQVTFSDPTGTGVVNLQKIHDAYNGTTSNTHIVIYIMELNPGGSITVKSSHNDSHVGTTMVLQYY